MTARSHVRQLADLLQPKKITWSATERRLQSALTIEDLRLAARRRTPRAIYDYVEGGAEHEIGLRHNRDVLESIRFAPTVLHDVSDPDLGVDVLGERSALPFAMAPTGYTRMMNHEGEIAVARVAAKAGIPYALATMGTTNAEQLARAVPQGRKWFQLYIWKDREASRTVVANAARFGFDTLIVTVDSAVTGLRVRDIRNGLSIPPALTARTVLDGARYPHWWLNFLTKEPVRFASLQRADEPLNKMANILYDQSVTIEDLEEVRAGWPGKFVVKGITSVQDAARFAALQPDAIVLSNHGGRQLDQVPHPLELIEEVRSAIGPDIEIWVDSGFQTGAEIVAAHALGADLVLVGRAYLWGIMAGGEAGVARAVEILTEEVRRTLRLIGCPSMADVTREHVRSIATERP